MPFPNNFFNKITAISSVEHILPIEDGDIKAFREIARTLKVGGKAIITVPYKSEFSQEWRKHQTQKSQN
jgi:ubiquinone/menaquinone biosynthesis C-methylase UbiE